MARVLIIDDSASLRMLLAATLTQGGHEVSEASNGAEALELAKKETFNLAISDLHMPIMDGLTFVRQLRVIPAYKFTPVLVLTTEMDPAAEKSARDAGATGWIVKPFDPEQLLSRIADVLSGA